MNSSALLFIFLIPIILTSAADPPHQPPSVSCSAELVNFSQCLSFVAMAPNNSTDSPSPHCCDDISSAYKNNSAVCLCYFARQTDIMGFPINSTKVMSLSSLCSLDGDNLLANVSLQTLCSGPAALPPLQSIRGVGSVNSPPVPDVDSSQGPAHSSPTEEEPAANHPARPASYIGKASPNENIKRIAWVISLLVYFCATART